MLVCGWALSCRRRTLLIDKTWLLFFSFNYPKCTVGGDITVFLWNCFLFILYFCEASSRPIQGIGSSQNILTSLLSWVSYRVISKYRIILVSPCFFTFMSLIQSYLKALNYLSFSSLLYFGKSGTRLEPRATWCLVAVFHSLLSLLVI